MEDAGARDGDGGERREEAGARAGAAVTLARTRGRAGTRAGDGEGLARHGA
jgi:hypothetical protein